jgi:hypothetical protein
VFLIKAEILLPLYDNDKRSIEDKKFEETYDDLTNQFEGVTIADKPLIGNWIDPTTQIHYDDEKNTACWVLCKKTKTNLYFLRKLKERLEKRFEQKSILIYYVNVYIL